MPFKDIGFLKFIKNKCFSVDYVFKGDDDIIIIPQNLAKEIQLIKDRPKIEAIGCMKGPDSVIRVPLNKYYVPRQIYVPDFYPPYFSGAGYVMTRTFALKMEEQIDHKPVLPLDDTYIGTLIKAANITFVHYFRIFEFFSVKI